MQLRALGHQRDLLAGRFLTACFLIGVARSLV